MDGRQPWMHHGHVRSSGCHEHVLLLAAGKGTRMTAALANGVVEVVVVVVVEGRGTGAVLHDGDGWRVEWCDMKCRRRRLMFGLAACRRRKCTDCKVVR